VAYLLFVTWSIQTGGSRKGYWPEWLARFAHSRGHHFCSFDYTLLPTGTIEDLDQDLNDFYTFASAGQMSRELNKRGFVSVDKDRIVV
jgi:hypothetical protein